MRQSRELAARIDAAASRIETMLIPDAGHDAVMTQPKVIADSVLQFLEEYLRALRRLTGASSGALS